MPGNYPFDYTGLAVTNKIQNELHTVNAASGANLSFIVPNAAPFFRQGLVVRRVSDNAVLVEDIHYKLTHRFVEASHGTGKQIFGSISFLDRNFSGQIKLEQYQTLGGTWVLDDNAIVVNLTNSLYSIHTVTWSQITGMPVAFPPIVHDHQADDLTGMVEIIAKLEEIRQVMITNYGDTAAITNALNNHLASPNAHTKAQVGLSNVENLPVATEPEALAGVANSYMTAVRVHQKIASLGLQNGSTYNFTIAPEAPPQAPGTIALQNGAFLKFTLSPEAPAQLVGEMNLKNGAFQTVTLPDNPPTAIPAETLPLKNGAFTNIVVSDTPPVAPPAGTLWLRPTV